MRSRSCVYKSGGEHLEDCITKSVACAGSTGRNFPKNVPVIVVDKLSDGDYKVAIGISTGRISEFHYSEIWKNWNPSNPEKVVVNEVLFYKICNKVPASVIGKTSQTDISIEKRKAVYDYVDKNGYLIYNI